MASPATLGYVSRMRLDEDAASRRMDTMRPLIVLLGLVAMTFGACAPDWPVVKRDAGPDGGDAEILGSEAGDGGSDQAMNQDESDGLDSGSGDDSHGRTEAGMPLS